MKDMIVKKEIEGFVWAKLNLDELFAGGEFDGVAITYQGHSITFDVQNKREKHD